MLLSNRLFGTSFRYWGQIERRMRYELLVSFQSHVWCFDTWLLQAFDKQLSSFNTTFAPLTPLNLPIYTILTNYVARIFLSQCWTGHEYHVHFITFAAFGRSYSYQLSCVRATYQQNQPHPDCKLQPSQLAVWLQPAVSIYLKNFNSAPFYFFS